MMLARRGAVVGAVALFAGVVSWSSGMLDGETQGAEERVEFIYLPPTRFLRTVSLGYEHALANVLWFRTISYFGRHYRRDRVYPWLASMCDVVTDLDPRAEHVYRFGGVMIPWEADRVDDGIALLEKGTRNLPDSWQLHYILGFSYYFFRNDLGAASRELRTATHSPGASPLISHLAASVEAAHRGPGRAIDFLTEFAGRNGDNDEMHGVIRQRIRELLLARDIDALEEAVRTFQAHSGRQPRDLTELVSAGILATVPDEPFGGRYLLDPASGQVVSSLGQKPWRLGSSRIREAFLRRAGSED